MSRPIKTGDVVNITFNDAGGSGTIGCNALKVDFVNEPPIEFECDCDLDEIRALKD